jgi:hypothetical protein
MTSRLRAFLDDSGQHGQEAAVDLAACPLFVEETQRQGASSRFVREGGVRFNRVTAYGLGARELPAMFGRRVGTPRIRPVLVKFWFNFDELPPGRQYAEIRVRVSLRPPAPVLFLDPLRETTEVESTMTVSTRAATSRALLAGVDVGRSSARSTRRTGSAPTAVAHDLGDDGFGWTYLAQDGMPLCGGREVALVLLELDRDTTELAGHFDAEALVTRRLLGLVNARRALPGRGPVPFDLSIAVAGQADD